MNSNFDICSSDVHSPGERFNIVLDKGNKVTKKDSKGRVWIQVYYVGKEKIKEKGWVAQEYVLRDKPIVTIPPETVTGKFNGKKKLLKSLSDWGGPGKGRYPAGQQKDSKGRFIVAVGPKILNPDYPDDGKLQMDELKAFSKYIQVYLEHKTQKAKKLIIDCVVNDLKAHSYNKYPDGQPCNLGVTASFNVENGIILQVSLIPNLRMQQKN